MYKLSTGDFLADAIQQVRGDLAAPFEGVLVSVSTLLAGVAGAGPIETLEG